MENRHLNVKKVILTIAVFVFAFIIIFLSAILTNKSHKKEENKDLQIKKVSEVKDVNLDNNVNKDNETKLNETVDENVNNNEEQDTEQNVDSKQEQNMAKKEEKNEKENKTSHNSSAINNTSANGKLPVYNEDSIQLVKQAQTGHEKNIYLTFDDGPSPNITPQILDILDNYNVPATFFVLGSRVELYPELVRQEFEAGHYIANHGYSHTYSQIYSSVQSVVDEYNSTEEAIQNALGNSDYHSYLFRFPGGSSGGPYDSLKSEAKQLLTNNGIASTNWNCLTGDAEGGARTKEQLLNRLYQTADGWDSLVVLMHDANDKQTTADALPEIIEHYKNEGYTFKNYYDIFK